MHKTGINSKICNLMRKILCFLVRNFILWVRNVSQLNWTSDHKSVFTSPKDNLEFSSLIPQSDSLIRDYTVCRSDCISWQHYSVVKSHCSSFRIITTVLGVWIFRIFTVIKKKNIINMTVTMMTMLFFIILNNGISYIFYPGLADHNITSNPSLMNLSCTRNYVDLLFKESVSPKCHSQ